MPARILMLPFLIATLICGYLTYQDGETYGIYLTIAVIPLVFLYISSPNINWWWYERNMATLPKSIQRMLEQAPFYQQLNEEDKKLFQHRTFMFDLGNEFMPQGWDDIPQDIKYMVAASAVAPTFKKASFLYENFEKIIMYPQAFPSPQFPRNLHSTEHFEDEESSGLMFSAEHVAKGFLQPKKYFNVALYEYARLFVKHNTAITFPTIGTDFWQKTQQLAGFNQASMQKYIGLPEVDAQAVSIVLYFVYGEQMKMVMSDLYDAYQEVFGY